MTVLELTNVVDIHSSVVEMIREFGEFRNRCPGPRPDGEKAAATHEYAIALIR